MHHGSPFVPGLGHLGICQGLMQTLKERRGLSTHLSNRANNRHPLPNPMPPNTHRGGGAQHLFASVSKLATARYTLFLTSIQGETTWHTAVFSEKHSTALPLHITPLFHFPSRKPLSLAPLTSRRCVGEKKNAAKKKLLQQTKGFLPFLLLFLFLL